MRTAFIASFLALATLVAAAPVVVVEGRAVAAAEPAAAAKVVETSELVHSLDKRASKCTKASQCSQSVPANAQRACESKKCSWTCNSGYSKTGSKCVKKASAAPVSQGPNLASTASFSGRGTWFTQNGVAGSCGQVNSDSTLLVAMNTPQVAGGAHCGQHVTITNTATGQSVRALVADECPGCSYGSLDLSLGAFKSIGNLDTGVLNIKWSWS